MYFACALLLNNKVFKGFALMFFVTNAVDRSCLGFTGRSGEFATPSFYRHLIYGYSHRLTSRRYNLKTYDI